jgi:hypothetical protein
VRGSPGVVGVGPGCWPVRNYRLVRLGGAREKAPAVYLGLGGSGFWVLASSTHNSPCLLLDPPSPDLPTEAFTAPAEVRHFTDGSFPPGFVLQLFSHTQLRTADSKDSPKEVKVTEEGLPQPESPSSGEPS